MLAVGGDEPGPAEEFAVADGGDGQIAALDAADRDGDHAVEDEENFLGGVALAKDLVAGLEGCLGGAGCEEFDMAVVHAGAERVVCQEGFKRGHDGAASAATVGRFKGGGAGESECARRRKAAASAVRSMPTGHQAMQRPQPTQPGVPN